MDRQTTKALKHFKTDYLAHKGVSYHTIKYGRFLLKPPCKNLYFMSVSSAL